MNHTLKLFQAAFSAMLLAGAQLSVLVAIIASQAGERALRGARGFAVYRDAGIGQR